MHLNILVSLGIAHWGHAHVLDDETEWACSEHLASQEAHKYSASHARSGSWQEWDFREVKTVTGFLLFSKQSTPVAELGQWNGRFGFFVDTGSLGMSWVQVHSQRMDSPGRVPFYAQVYFQPFTTQKLRLLLLRWDGQEVELVGVPLGCRALPKFAFETIYPQMRFNSMVSPKKLKILYDQVVRLDAHLVRGDFVECGVWAGGLSMMMAMTTFRSRNLWLFDTFEGVPQPVVEYDGKRAYDHWKNLKPGPYNIKGFIDPNGIRRWNYMPDFVVRDNILDTGHNSSRVHLIKGKVEDTLQSARNLPFQIAALWLDTDLYHSTKAELDVLFDRLVVGGVLVIDDYEYWDGARRAADEFFESRAHCVERISSEWYMAIKKPCERNAKSLQFVLGCKAAPQSLHLLSNSRHGAATRRADGHVVDCGVEVGAVMAPTIATTLAFPQRNLAYFSSRSPSYKIASHAGDDSVIRWNYIPAWVLKEPRPPPNPNISGSLHHSDGIASEGVSSSMPALPATILELRVDGDFYALAHTSLEDLFDRLVEGGLFAVADATAWVGGTAWSSNRFMRSRGHCLTRLGHGGLGAVKRACVHHAFKTNRSPKD